LMRNAVTAADNGAQFLYVAFHLFRRIFGIFTNNFS